MKLGEEVEALGPKFESLFSGDADTLRLSELPGLVELSSQLRKKLGKLVDEIDEFNEMLVEPDPSKDLERVLSDVRQLAESVRTTINTPEFGLKPIEINPDDAMVTALVLRYELMTQRETAADDWRRIKLAADELKSVLNINARQVIRTENGSNQPFNFTLDDSTTQLGVTFDAPLNRFAPTQQLSSVADQLPTFAAKPDAARGHHQIFSSQ